MENPYFQYFCGEEFFQHALVFDRSSLTRWRQRMGEEKLQALLQESLAVATRTEAMKPSDLARVVIDTTVQFRITIAKQTLSRELRAMGYRKLSARPRHHAQAEGAIEDFKKTSPRAWRQLRARRRLTATR